MEVNVVHDESVVTFTMCLFVGIGGEESLFISHVSQTVKLEAKHPKFSNLARLWLAVFVYNWLWFRAYTNHAAETF